MYQLFHERLNKYQLIGAIKDPKSLDLALRYKENLSAVILMTGNILNVQQYVQVLHEAELPVILHVEKIGGLQGDRYGIDFIAEVVKPFAIVTTKANIIKRAKSKGIYVVQRIFLVDTEVFLQLEKTIENSAADMIEIMPCRAPDFLKKLAKNTKKPIITGGLLNTVEQAEVALISGVKAVTTSNIEMWKTVLHKTKINS